MNIDAQRRTAHKNVSGAPLPPTFWRPLTGKHGAEGGRSIPGRSGQTIADAEHQMTEGAVETAVWTACVARWRYSLGSLKRL